MVRTAWIVFLSSAPISYQYPYLYRNIIYYLILSVSTLERGSVTNNLDAYNFEDVGFKSGYPTSASVEAVFRCFNTKTGAHFLHSLPPKQIVL